MALFLPEAQERLGRARRFALTTAGAEANVATAMARLGFRSGWFGHVGDDELGELILKGLRGDGVDVSQVVRDPTAPTGMIVRESRSDRDPRVYYYRKGSAGSRLGPGAVNGDYLSGARLLHITGITPALSSSCLEAVEASLAVAQAHGIPVGLDPNLRLKLWSAPEAAATLVPWLPRVSVVLSGLEEGERLSGRSGEEAVSAWYLEHGAKLVVLKLGSEGAMATDGSQVWRAPGFQVRMVDSVGAGDAFAAGFYAGWLSGWSMVDCLRSGNACGALAVGTVGDVESMPYRDEWLHMLGHEPTSPLR